MGVVEVGAAGAEFVGRSLTLISSGPCKWATIFNYVSVLLVRHIWSHASLGKYVKNAGFFLLLGCRNCLVLNSNAPFLCWILFAGQMCEGF